MRATRHLQGQRLLVHGSSLLFPSREECGPLGFPGAWGQDVCTRGHSDPVYSVHEPPRMPSALLSGYKEGPETGGGVGRGAPGSGSGLGEGEPDGPPPGLGSTRLSAVLASSLATLEVIQR